MSAEKQRDQALSILQENLRSLSILYKESYLSLGRGALLVYASDVVDGRALGNSNYRTRKEMLELFDEPASQAKLAKMIDEYDSAKEGVIVLITSHSNQTYFIFVKLI
jgi:hypothetical protein